MYTLFGTRGSGSAIIELALERAAQPYRLLRASAWEPDSAQDELRRHNPLLQVPTLLLPDGTVMSESAAILIHLGLVHPESRLLPEDPAGRARVMRGLVFIAANCYSAITLLDYPERFCEPLEAPQREALLRGTRAQLHRQWERFADLFGGVWDGGPCLNGAQPGALDFMALVVSRWSGSRQHLAQTRPAFHAQLQALEARPELAALLARHWGPA